jgi:uncharacterized repeat protein (TIGR01451 family)
MDTVTTDNNGNYVFEDVSPNTEYEVCEVMQDGWFQTYPGFNTCFGVTTTQDDLIEIDFGNKEQYDLEISKIADKDEVVKGDIINYTLTFTNVSEVDAYDVVTYDLLPSNTFINIEESDPNCDFIEITEGFYELNCFIDELLAGESYEFQYSAVVDDVDNDGQLGEVVSNTAAIYSFIDLFNIIFELEFITETDYSNNEVVLEIPIRDRVPTISLAGQSPAVNGNGEVTVDEGVDFRMIASQDVIGDPNFSYEYSGVCDGSVTDTDSSSYVSEVLNLAPGTYTCEVTVTDYDGDTDTQSITIEVAEVQQEDNSDNTTDNTSDENTNNTSGGDNTNTQTETETETNNFIGTNNIGQVEGTNEEEEVEEEEEEETNGESGEVLGTQVCDETNLLGGNLFIDENGNDERDEGERAFDAITVQIYAENQDGERELVDERITDENGYWESELCPGEYEIVIIEEDIPEGFALVEGENNKIVSLSNESDNVDITIEVEDVDQGLNWLLICLVAVITLLLLSALFFLISRSAENKNRR